MIVEDSGPVTERLRIEKDPRGLGLAGLFGSMDVTLSIHRPPS